VEVILATSYRKGPETERLLMRAFEPSDAAAFYRLASDPDIIRYTGEPPCQSLEAAAAGIAAYPDWADPGYGRWATVYKPEGKIIGFAGLKYLAQFQEVDLGYRFLPEFWGRGLATEASKACLRFGFEVIRLRRVVGYTDPENAASMRVLEKVGLLRGEPILYDGLPTEAFAIERERYDRVSRDWEGPNA
jgi:[ribosomal protein S5]-alanine N-acetyltransferase